MANNSGGGTKGYRPLAQFQQDIYSELEKPISTQNLDDVIRKVGLVIDEVKRAHDGFEKLMASGKKVPTTYIQNLTKEVQNASKALEYADKKIAEFETYSNAKKNFPQQYQKAYELRNRLSSVKVTGQHTLDDATGVTAQRERERAQRQQERAEEAKRAKEEEARAQESRRIREQEKKQAIVDVGNEKPKGEVLPTEQVKAQSDSVVASAKKASDTIGSSFENTANTIKSSFSVNDVEAWANALIKSGKESEEILDALDAKMDEINEEMEEMDVSKVDKHTPNANAINDNLTAEIEKRGEALEKLRQIRNDEANLFRLGQEIEKADTSWITKENNSLEDLSETYKLLLGDKKSIESKKSIDKMTDDELKEYAQIIASLSRIAEIKNGKNKGDSPIPNGGKTASNTATPQTENEIKSLEELKNRILQTREALDALHERAKTGEETDLSKSAEEAKTLQDELKKLETMYTRLTGEKASALKPQQPKENEQPLQAPQNYDAVVARIKELKKEIPFAKMKVIDAPDVAEAVKNIKALEDELKRLEQIRDSASQWTYGAQLAASFKSLGTHVSMFANGMKNAFKTVGSAVSTVGSTIHNFVSSALGMLSKGLSSVLGGMHSLVSGGFNAVKNGVNAVKSGFHQLSKSMHQIVKKGTPNILKSFSSIKSMLMRRIKRTFISSIFNQAKEGLQQLAKSSNDFNKSMSNIKNSAKEVAGNLSITLGNLVQMLEPVITTVLGWLNSVFEAINGLFALITGKKTMMVAKKGTDDYAKSLKGASKSAKDLNHQLYGFDEITRQEDNSGGGGGAGKIGYKQANIEDRLGGINDFFKQMLDAFKKGQFEKVGSLIAEQLNNLTLTIDKWVNGLRSKAVLWSANIARILNGIVADKELFHNMGVLIGDGLNLVFDVFNTFLETFNFVELGKALGTKINAIFTTIDWELVGRTIANYLRSIWQTIGNLFATIDWQGIGLRLANGLMSLVRNIDWEAFKLMWSQGINGVFNLLYTLFENIDFAKIATDLDTNLTDLVENKIDWTKIGDAILAGIAGLQDAFHVLVNSQFFNSLASKLGKTFGGILANIEWGKLASDILQGIAQLTEAFGTFLVSLDLPNVAIKIADGINALFDPQNGGASFDTAIDAVTNGVNSLIEGFSNLVDPEKGINFSNIASTLSEKINKLITKTDWATLISTIVGLKIDLYDALFQAIGEIDWETLGKKISDAVNNLFTEERLKSLGKNIGNAVKGVLEGITSLISNIDWEKVGSGIIEFIKSIDWGKVLESIIHLLISAVSGVGSLITGLWKAIFGGGDGQEVEVPQILSDNVMEQLRQQMGEAGKKLAGYLQDSLVKSLEGAGTEYDSAKQLFINSIAMIGTGAQEEWENTLSKMNVPPERIALLAEQVGELFSVLEMPDATAEQIREAFKQNGIWITNGLAESFVGQGKENVSRAMQLLGMGVDEETLRMLDLTNLNANLTSYMNETGKSIETIAEELGAGVGENMGKAIPEATVKALNIGKKQVEETKDEIVESASASAQDVQNATKSGTALGEGATGAIADSTNDGKTGVEDATNSVTSVVKEKYEALPDEVKPYAEQLMEYIVTALSDQDGTVKSAIEAVAQGAVDRAKEILNGQTGMEIAKTFLDGIMNAIKVNYSITNTIIMKVSEAIKYAQSYFNYSNGYTIGQNLITGLYNGFHSYSQKLVDFIAHVCGVCIETAREILGIASPSKVFAEIGAYTMEGMQIGLEKQGENAIDTVADVANAITKVGEKASFENIMGDGIDIVASKLEKIVDIFSDMADVVASMGGLQIPTVASGRTIPYSTQLGSSAFGGNMVNANIDENAIENAFYSAITRALDNSSNTQNINIYLDGRQIADSVTKYQRRQARAMGV